MNRPTADTTTTEAGGVSASDEAIMRAVQAGHLELLGILYERHSRRVFAHCLRRIGDPGAADDLLQDRAEPGS